MVPKQKTGAGLAAAAAVRSAVPGRSPSLVAQADHQFTRMDVARERQTAGANAYQGLQ